jgi:putative endonuclease
LEEKTYFVYILTNSRNSVLYTGVTNDLKKRIYTHKNKQVDGFSKKYNVDKLVCFECGYDPLAAIFREKQIKAGPRRKKIELIERMNKNWEDLYEQL